MLGDVVEQFDFGRRRCRFFNGVRIGEKPLFGGLFLRQLLARQFGFLVSIPVHGQRGGKYFSGSTGLP